jgi:hypothetical protein
MSKQIRLNAFDMNCSGHIQHGTWAHPLDQSADYDTLENRQHLARTAPLPGRRSTTGSLVDGLTPVPDREINRGDRR